MLGFVLASFLVMVLSEEAKKNPRIIHELSRNPFLMGLQRDFFKVCKASLEFGFTMIISLGS